MKHPLMFSALVLGCLPLGCAGGGHNAGPPGTLVVDRPLAPARLTVCYFGDPPRLLGHALIQGNGLAAEVRSPSSRTLWSLNIGEADPPAAIDYSEASAGKLRVVYHTRDPRRPYEDAVPFVEETVLVETGDRVRIRRAVVLPKGEFDPVRAGDLAKSARGAIHSEESDSCDRLESCLGELRNMGLDRPVEVLTILAGLAAESDGAYSKLVDKYRTEVELAVEIMADKAGG